MVRTRIVLLGDMGMDVRRNPERDSTFLALTDNIGREPHGINFLEPLGEVRQNCSNVHKLDGALSNRPLIS